MEDDDLIPLSALQHYLYCPRQFALIHVERLWSENRQTAEGRLLHGRADQPLTEQRHGVRTATAMPLNNKALGIAGVADVVEFHATDEGDTAYPVEYKRGRPKAHRADEVQLCAQALCLESMLGETLKKGALFYGKTRRRIEVEFDEALRQLTIDTIRATRELLDRGQTPAARYESAKCDSCSMIGWCQPRLLNRRESVNAWLARELKD